MYKHCMISKYIRLQVGFYPRQSKAQQGREGRFFFLNFNKSNDKGHTKQE
jgi:hypothetical protein